MGKLKLLHLSSFTGSFIRFSLIYLIVDGSFLFIMKLLLKKIACITHIHLSPALIRIPNLFLPGYFFFYKNPHLKK